LCQTFFFHISLCGFVVLWRRLWTGRTGPQIALRPLNLVDLKNTFTLQLYNQVSVGWEHKLCKCTTLSHFIVSSYLPVCGLEHVIVSIASVFDGPVNLPHRSASLPMMPFLAEVLLTKTRAFLNRFPQQSRLLSKTNH
jgi:hypothetical protein